MGRIEQTAAGSDRHVSSAVSRRALLTCVALWALISSASTSAPTPGTSGPASTNAIAVDWTWQESPPEVVVYASELSKGSLSEFDFWDDPSSPGGRLIGTPNTGDELDPPPENDPHVTFTVAVRAGVPYRCWIHMKVGAPKGVSTANMFWVQFSDAVDGANEVVLGPRTSSYLTARGPTRQGWAWVGCDLEGSSSTESLVRFSRSGEVTVRLQAGQEGVGFDQFLLSPRRFLEKPPTEAVVSKA